MPAGYTADRTGHYWLITFVGYVIDRFATPAMVLAGSWKLAAAFVLAERIGPALRQPTVEAMYDSPALQGLGIYTLNTATSNDLLIHLHDP